MVSWDFTLELNVTSGSEREQARNEADRTAATSGDEFNVISHAVGQDVRLEAILLTYSLYEMTDEGSTPTVPSPTNVAVQVSNRANFVEPDQQAGVYWHQELVSIPAQFFEDGTNGTGGAHGGNPGEMQVIIDPANDSPEVDNTMDAGQSLNVHVRYRDATSPDLAQEDVELQAVTRAL